MDRWTEADTSDQLLLLLIFKLQNLKLRFQAPVYAWYMVHFLKGSSILLCRSLYIVEAVKPKSQVRDPVTDLLFPQKLLELGIRLVNL